MHSFMTVGVSCFGFRLGSNKDALQVVHVALTCSQPESMKNNVAINCTLAGVTVGAELVVSEL